MLADIVSVVASSKFFTFLINNKYSRCHYLINYFTLKGDCEACDQIYQFQFSQRAIFVQKSFSAKVDPPKPRPVRVYQKTAIKVLAAEQCIEKTMISYALFSISCKAEIKLSTSLLFFTLYCFAILISIKSKENMEFSSPTRPLSCTTSD